MSECELKKRRLLLQYLHALERELREQSLWQVEKPSAQALRSTAPFAIDRLTFVQWLQFIFLEKMGKLVEEVQPLPTAISVLPMATEYFSPLSVDSAAIENIIGRIDSLISG